MRTLAALTALLFLVPSSGTDMRVRAAQYRAAQAAHAKVAVDRARAQAFYVPAPPAVHYVQGYAPGLTQETAAGTAAYDEDTDTVYYQGRLRKSTKAHELGHALDDQVLNDGDRVYFQKLLHAPAGDWRTGTGLQGLASPNEIFADYYQAAALHLDPRRQSEASYTTVGAIRLKRFEAALARLGKRRHLTQYR